MIKHIILNLILCCSLVFPAMAQENGEGIRFFEGTWEEALQKAKEENKLIFMDCYSTPGAAPAPKWSGRFSR